MRVDRRLRLSNGNNIEESGGELSISSLLKSNVRTTRMQLDGLEYVRFSNAKFPFRVCDDVREPELSDPR